MADPTTVTSLKVYYSDGGQSASKTLKFKGNFGFSLGGRQYKVNEGHVYDSNGKPVQGLKMPKTMAYQFIGMSNTAEVASNAARDYTYAPSDMKTAEEKFSYGGNSVLSSLIVGTGATKGVKNGYANYHQTQTQDGAKRNEYSTNYHHRVSVWQE